MMTVESVGAALGKAVPAHGQARALLFSVAGTEKVHGLAHQWAAPAHYWAGRPHYWAGRPRYWAGRPRYWVLS